MVWCYLNNYHEVFFFFGQNFVFEVKVSYTSELSHKIFITEIRKKEVSDRSKMKARISMKVKKKQKVFQIHFNIYLENVA